MKRISIIGKHFSLILPCILFIVLITGCGTAAMAERPASNLVKKASASRFTAFVGEWYAHGGGLIFNANGDAQYIARVYSWCGSGVKPPCDTIKGNEITPGIHMNLTFSKTKNNTAYGKITKTDTGNTGSQVTLQTGPNDTLQFTESSSAEPHVLCGPRSPVGYCGA